MCMAMGNTFHDLDVLGCNFLCVSAHFGWSFCDFWICLSKSGNTEALMRPIPNRKSASKTSYLIEYLPKKEPFDIQVFLLQI